MRQVKKKIPIDHGEDSHFAGFWYVLCSDHTCHLPLLLCDCSDDVVRAVNNGFSFSNGEVSAAQIYVHDLENKITDGFGERVHPVTGEESFHTGIDIGVPVGTPICSLPRWCRQNRILSKDVGSGRDEECRYQRGYREL